MFLSTSFWWISFVIIIEHSSHHQSLQAVPIFPHLQLVTIEPFVERCQPFVILSLRELSSNHPGPQFLAHMGEGVVTMIYQAWPTVMFRCSYDYPIIIRRYYYQQAIIIIDNYRPSQTTMNHLP